jgi:hypothetical protein
MKKKNKNKIPEEEYKEKWEGDRNGNKENVAFCVFEEQKNNEEEEDEDEEEEEERKRRRRRRRKKKKKTKKKRTKEEGRSSRKRELRAEKGRHGCCGFCHLPHQRLRQGQHTPRQALPQTGPQR